MSEGWSGSMGSGVTGDFTDDDGAPLVSTDTDGGAAQPIGAALRRQIMAGIPNGDFRLAPQSPDGEITDENTLPYWTLTKATGTEIRVYSVIDTASASGRVIRFNLGESVASDETYLEQIVPVNGSRGQSFAYNPKATWRAPVFTGGNAAIKLKAQYLKADGTTTGSETVSTVNFTLILTDPQDVPLPLGAVVVPADAYWLRVRVGILQATANAGATADLTEVRVQPAEDDLYLVDQANPANAPARLRKNNGVLSVDPGSGGSTHLSGDVDVVSAGVLSVSGTTVSLVGHGAADHADRTRSLFLAPEEGTVLDGAALATVTASPNPIRSVDLTDNLDQGAFWTFGTPADWASGNLIAQPIWVPSAADAVAHTVSWQYRTDKLVDGVALAGGSVSFTGISAVRSTLVVFDTATSLGMNNGANGPIRLFVRRMGLTGAGTTDTYVGNVRLLGVLITYTADG